MATRIEQKILSASVVSKPTVAAETPSNVIHMHEAVERPEKLIGATIKIKNQFVENAIYMTVNHIVLNPGTKHESVRPFEVFLNTKDASMAQHFAAITRLLSAVFRKGGDFTFVIEELKSIHDPRGGCFLPGGRFVNSVMHHIALELEAHFQEIGAMRLPELAEEVKATLEAKTEQARQVGALDNAATCPKCHEQKYVLMDGCSTCLDCGYSKCG